LILPTSRRCVVFNGTACTKRRPAASGCWASCYNPTVLAAHVQLHVCWSARGASVREACVSALDVIRRAGAHPFGVLFPARPAGLANFHIELLSAEAYTHDGPCAGCWVTGEQGGPAGALYRVTGTLRNARATALDALVVVTLYDEQGLVVGFERESAGTLAPGASATFDVRVVPAGSGAARYTLAVQGTKP
jgi:hypothetical protein